MKPQVKIYARHNCHLCESALEVALEARQKISFELEIIYIDDNKQLQVQYGEEVPVTLIQGKIHDYFTLESKRFVKALELAAKSEEKRNL
jgi:glutaredoxin